MYRTRATLSRIWYRSDVINKIRVMLQTPDLSKYVERHMNRYNMQRTYSGLPAYWRPGCMFTIQYMMIIDDKPC